MTQTGRLRKCAAAPFVYVPQSLYMLKMERFFILYLLQMSIAWTR